MNSACFFPFDFTSLVQMENMYAGFMAEGLDARRRAIDDYMKHNGSKKNKEAWEYLQLLDKLEKSPLSKLEMLQLHTGLDALLGVNPNGKDRVPPHPEKCPLALYAAAVFFLHPTIAVFRPAKALPYAKMAQAHGCRPAQAIRMDIAIRGLLACGAPFRECGEGEGPCAADQKPQSEFPTWAEIEAELDEILRDPTEESLLVAGRTLALVNVFPEDFASRIRERLKMLAQGGHVDALRLLALSHTAELEPEPEVQWAREKILALADEGKPFARLVKAQNLAGLFNFWCPDKVRKGMHVDEAVLEKCLDEARIILEDLAAEKHPWAAATLAWLFLEIHDWEDFPEFESFRHAMEILEEDINEEQFPPSATLAGAAIFNFLEDPEQAESLLKWAAESGYSCACEGALGYFLMCMVQNARYINDVKAGLVERPDDFEDDAHGSLESWCVELVEYGKHILFGESQLWGLRMMLGEGMPFTQDEPDHVSYSFACSRDMVGPFTVFGHLVNLGCTSDGVGFLQEEIERSLLQGALNGDPSCLLGHLFFAKANRGGGLENRSIPEIQAACAHLSSCSTLAAFASNFFGLLALCAADIYIGAFLDDLPEGNPGKTGGLLPGHEDEAEERKEHQLELLQGGYEFARRTYDLPVLCLLPVLLRMAATFYEPEIVEAVTGRLSSRIFGEKLDFAGILAVLSRDIALEGVDPRLLWTNLGIMEGASLEPVENRRIGLYTTMKEDFRMEKEPGSIWRSTTRRSTAKRKAKSGQKRKRGRR